MWVKVLSMLCQWEMFFLLLHISLIIYQLGFLALPRASSQWIICVTLQSFSKSLLSGMQPHKHVKLVYINYSLQYSSGTDVIIHTTRLLTDCEHQESLCITDLLLLPFYFSSFLPRDSPAWGALKCCPSILLSSRKGNNSYSSPLPFPASFTFTWNCYFFPMCVQNQVLINFLPLFFPPVFIVLVSWSVWQLWEICIIIS